MTGHPGDYPEPDYPEHWTPQDRGLYERGGDPDITGGAVIWSSISILVLVALLLWWIIL